MPGNLGDPPPAPWHHSWPWGVPGVLVAAYLISDASEAAGAFLEALRTPASTGGVGEVLAFAAASLVYTSFLVALAVVCARMSVRLAREGSVRGAVAFLFVLVPCLASGYVVSGPMVRTVSDVERVRAECERLAEAASTGGAGPETTARLLPLLRDYAVCAKAVEAVVSRTADTDADTKDTRSSSRTSD